MKGNRRRQHRRWHGIVADDAHHFLHQIILDIYVIAPPRDNYVQSAAAGYIRALKPQGFQCRLSPRRFDFHPQRLPQPPHRKPD